MLARNFFGETEKHNQRDSRRRLRPGGGARARADLKGLRKKLARRRFRPMRELFNKGLGSLRERGVGGTLGRVANSLKARVGGRTDRADGARYAQWVRRFDAPSE